MIAKKNPKLNFERRRFAFFQIGLIVAGTMTLVAFRWATPTGITENEEVAPELTREFTYDIIEKPKVIEQKQQVTKQERTVAVITDIVNPVDDLKKKDDGIIEPFIEPGNFKVGTSTSLPPGDPVLSNERFEIVEKMPEFIGGEEAMMSYFGKAIKYPEISVRMGDQGRVYVKFLVRDNGAISDVHVVKGVTPELDAEAIRVVRKMPDWKPGKQRGRPVNVWYVVPINFSLK